MQPTLAQATVVNGGLVAGMWGLEVVDYATLHSLDQFGITPRNFGDFFDIFLAPWLHFGWAHLISNSVPFLVLGTLIYISGRAEYLKTLFVTIVVSGLTVWLLSPTGTNTAGASGVVFGFLTYLLVRGFFTKKIGQILLAVLVFLLYGGVLWGVLPTAAGISWQAHLGGAGGGLLSAWLMHGGNTQPARSTGAQR
ncbi:rhomboid family intramembrane serine protease [uncultured Tessaracoccus sp.]|uniref:rhomboid family intramembrane serine protease n=1 Tax=uncultured Tessaracoccus sp. TaxID=905023 RepID=UPI00345D2A9A